MIKILIAITGFPNNTLLGSAFYRVSRIVMLVLELIWVTADTLIKLGSHMVLSHADLMITLCLIDRASACIFSALENVYDAIEIRSIESDKSEFQVCISFVFLSR